MHLGAVIYSSPTCQPCRAAKRWMQENNVPYTEKDAMEHIEELKELGIRITLPIIKYRDIVIQGFNPTELKKAFPLD